MVWALIAIAYLAAVALILSWGRGARIADEEREHVIARWLGEREAKALPHSGQHKAA